MNTEITDLYIANSNLNFEFTKQKKSIGTPCSHGSNTYRLNKHVVKSVTSKSQSNSLVSITSNIKTNETIKHYCI